MVVTVLVVVMVVVVVVVTGGDRDIVHVLAEILGDQGKGVTKNSFKDKFHKNAVFYLVPGCV